MSNFWIKVGCFLTGYNYKILSECSEASFKHVKKMTSALIIVSLIWSFIGYTFATQYFDTGILGGIFGAIIATVVVIQIERQIILNVDNNIGAIIFRILLAFLMAFLGGLFIDQIIFADDIEIESMKLRQEKLEERVLHETSRVNDAIAEIQKEIINQENEISLLENEVSEKPYVISTIYKTVPDEKLRLVTDTIDGNVDTRYVTIKTTKRVPEQIQKANPKFDRIPILNARVDKSYANIDSLKNSLTLYRYQTNEDLKDKKGFLDEITTLKSLLSGNISALAVYLVIFSFFLFIEMFVVVSKLHSKKNDIDYDVIIRHHRDTKKKIIENLQKSFNDKSKD